MPSKLLSDEHLRFLYICLQNSDYKSVSFIIIALLSLLTSHQIDFNSVGNATNLKPPAARMRYTRLAKAIESGMSFEKNSEPCQGGPHESKGASKKRKRAMHESGDSNTDQNTLPGDGHPASGSENSHNDSDGGNIALSEKLDLALTTRKPTELFNKVVATQDGTVNSSTSAALPSGKESVSLNTNLTAGLGHNDEDFGDSNHHIL